MTAADSDPHLLLATFKLELVGLAALKALTSGQVAHKELPPAVSLLASAAGAMPYDLVPDLLKLIGQVVTTSFDQEPDRLAEMPASIAAAIANFQTVHELDLSTREADATR